MTNELSFVLLVAEKSLKCFVAAPTISLLKISFTIPQKVFGNTCAETEITPTAPEYISGSVMLSSPEITKNPSGASFIICITCEKFPLASFTPINFFDAFASRKIVSEEILEDVRDGTL